MLSTCPSTYLHYARSLCPWISPGKNTGVGSLFLLQGIFLTQDRGLPPCRRILYHLGHQRSPRLHTDVDIAVRRIWRWAHTSCSLVCITFIIPRTVNRMDFTPQLGPIYVSLRREDFSRWAWPNHMSPSSLNLEIGVWEVRKKSMMGVQFEGDSCWRHRGPCGKKCGVAPGAESSPWLQPGRNIHAWFYNILGPPW